MNTRPITARQQEILNFIISYIQDSKYPPTIREISENFAISAKGAHDHVKALEKKRRIRCDTGRSRAIEVLNPPEAPSSVDEVREIPLLGNVAAGAPLLSVENREGTVKVPASYLRNKDYFALHVQGNSMIGAGILDGDVAIVEQQPVAENGDIVVAMVEESVTLKRFYREANRVQLKAENPAYPPIYTRDVRILGKLAHIVRSYN